MRKLLLLCLCSSMYLSSLTMAADMEATSIQALIEQHTTTVKASEAVNGLVPAMRQIVKSPNHAGIEFNVVDLALIRSFRTSDEGRLVIDSYVPDMESALARTDPDAMHEIGVILSEAREAEQRVYRKQFESLINSLSPDGQRKVRAWLIEAMEKIQYTNVDWSAIGEAAPEYVRSMAERFASSVASRADRAAQRERLGRQVSEQGSWGIVTGEGQ